MFEPPVLAAGAFALACQDVDVDPTEFSTGGGDNSIASTSTLQGWLQVFDVSQEEVDGQWQRRLIVTRHPIHVAHLLHTPTQTAQPH